MRAHQNRIQDPQNHLLDLQDHLQDPQNHLQDLQDHLQDPQNHLQDLQKHLLEPQKHLQDPKSPQKIYEKSRVPWYTPCSSLFSSLGVPWLCHHD